MNEKTLIELSEDIRSKEISLPSLKANLNNISNDALVGLVA